MFALTYLCEVSADLRDRYNAVSCDGTKVYKNTIINASCARGGVLLIRLWVGELWVVVCSCSVVAQQSFYTGEYTCTHMMRCVSIETRSSICAVLLYTCWVRILYNICLVYIYILHLYDVSPHCFLCWNKRSTFTLKLNTMEIFSAKQIYHNNSVTVFSDTIWSFFFLLTKPNFVTLLTGWLAACWCYLSCFF